MPVYRSVVSDGDKANLDFTPNYYTPTVVSGQSESVIQLTSHLKGIDDNFYYKQFIPTQSQKEALAGTYGLPTVSNKYVTDIDPRLTRNLKLKSISYAAVAGDYCILASGTITITLPDVTSSLQYEYVIKNIGSDIVTVKGNGTQLIDASNTITLTAPGICKVICDGTKWYRIQ